MQKEAGKDISIIIVGNKCDLENERKITKKKDKIRLKIKTALFQNFGF